MSRTDADRTGPGPLPRWAGLPVGDGEPESARALHLHGHAVPAAPPGTGKTTLVPPALAGLVPGLPVPARMPVAEPRRPAARPLPGLDPALVRTALLGRLRREGVEAVAPSCAPPTRGSAGR